MPQSYVTTGQQFESGKGGGPGSGGPGAYEYQKRLISLENYRYDYEPDWLDIQRYILPRKGLFYRRGQKVSDAGGKKRDHSGIIDPEATLDLKDLAAALLSGMTPKTRPWLRLSAQNSDLMDYPPVKAWFHDVTTKMLSIFSWSNLYSALHSVYRETAGFGTGAILEEEDLESLIRFITFTTGEFYIAVNERGEVDTFYRQFEMTANNIVNMFGKDSVSGDVSSEYKKGVISGAIMDAAKRADAQDKYFQICHAIQPNKLRKPGMVDNKNMMFESVYWERARPQNFLRKSGYEELPVFCPRWDVVSTQHPYGESPTKDVLGHVKMLQEMNSDELRAVRQQARPSMQVPAQYKGRLSMLPGAQNVKPSDDSKIERLFDFKFEHEGVHEKIADIREQLRRGYFIDLLKMISVRPGIQPLSAAEVASREGERLVLLSPIIERFDSDLLNNLVKRTFGIMLRHDVVGPPPPEIQGERVKVEYTSQLAQIQKLVGLQPIEHLLGFLASAGGLQPQLMDKVDFDEMVDEYADAAGVPPKIIVSDETVKAIRAARAKAAEAQQRDQMAAGMVQGAKSLSETSTEPGNVVGDVLQSMGVGAA